MPPPLGPEGERGLTLLVVDDVRVDRQRIIKAAHASRLRFEVVEATNADEALRVIAEQSVDAVILEHVLPGTDGLALLHQLRRGDPLLPMVFVTGHGNEALAAEVLKTGADYLTKDALESQQLIQSLRHVIAHRRQKLREQADREALDEHAAHLTRSLEEARKAVHARDEVMAIVSHDLRNPLNTVKLAVSLLQEACSDGGDTAEVPVLVGQIERAVGRMNRLIDDLMDASRIDANTLVVSLQPTLVAEVIEAGIDGCAATARDQKIVLAQGAVDRGLRVMADGHRLAQVLWNLVGNAIKFTPSGGRVTLDACPVSDRWVEISVTDTGRGIAPESLPHVFERFWKVRAETREGAGLGLYIANGIVSAHYGEMSVTSELGVGTRFAFRIPRW